MQYLLQPDTLKCFNVRKNGFALDSLGLNYVTCIFTDGEELSFSLAASGTLYMTDETHDGADNLRFREVLKKYSIYHWPY